MQRTGDQRRRPRLVIDGQALVEEHFSGVGQYTAGVLRALDGLLLDGEAELDARIAVPFKRVDRLGRFGFRRIRPLRIPLPLSIQRRLIVEERLPPMDLFLGRGTYFFPNFWRWPLARSRSVTAVHDISFELMPEFADADNGAFLRREVRRSVERSDRVTALTATTADEIAAHYGVPRSRIEVVGCAVDRTRFYRRSDAEVARVARRHGIYGPYVVSVGNIEPRKNQVRLIDAFCSLPRDRTDGVTLVLAGAGAWNEGEIRARERRAVDDGHRVKVLLGAVGDDEMPALYTGALFSVYVSLYEGFGMPPLESMACGTPVLASAVSVMPEVTGGAAHLCEVDGVEPIAAGLAAMLAIGDDERSAMVAAGHANVARYDWTDQARTLLRTLGEAGRW